MARIAESVQHYIGTSAEAKPLPTDTERIPVGSTFRETDTRAVAWWDGEGWRGGDPQTAGLVMQGAMLNELTRIRVALEVLADIETDDAE